MREKHLDTIPFFIMLDPSARTHIFRSLFSAATSTDQDTVLLPCFRDLLKERAVMTMLGRHPRPPGSRVIQQGFFVQMLFTAGQCSNTPDASCRLGYTHYQPGKTNDSTTQTLTTASETTLPPDVPSSFAFLRSFA
jgi:hypothetical protein